MRLGWLVTLALPACGFSVGATTAPGDAIDASDGGGGDEAPATDMVGDVAHVPPAIETAFAATADLTITGTVTIDTGRMGVGAPMASIALPGGAALVTSPQDDAAARELAILEVGSLNVQGTLRIRGWRPLVIIALHTISVTGAIDASADHGVPGGGGWDARLGPGKGGDGVDDATSFDDSGGGGGGYGTAGSAGQASGPSPSGAAGGSYGGPMQMRLEGGSGGGDVSPPCTGKSAGAGGGAIQLYAANTITIDGTVAANGGGGAGGTICNGLAGSGGGGGSGGAIYLQARTIAGGGALFAQGGAAGGGSNFNANVAGGDGANGALAISAASGGTGAGTGVGGEFNSGATGGFRNGAPGTLVQLSGMNYGNGGGGGGGVGRIAVRATTPGALSASPQAALLAP